MLVLPGGRPPPRAHRRESENFYILESQFAFLVENRWVQAAPGSFVRATKDCLHTLKNTGDSVGKLLVLAVPAGLDKFFEETGKLGTGISSPPAPPDAEKLLAAERHGIESPHLPRSKSPVSLAECGS